MLVIVWFGASALALILVASYYLLASIPFSYYHFLQVPQVWWLPLFIRFHPLVLAASLTGISPRASALPAHLRPWTRYVTLAGVTLAVCMAAGVVVPAVLSYELAAALTFAPLLLLIAASVLRIAAAGAERSNHGPGSASPGDVSIGATGVVAGLLVGTAYAAASGWQGAAASLGRTTFLAASAISIVSHLGCFTLAALAIALARRWSRRGAAGPRRERIALAVCAALASAVVIRRSLLTALILSDLRAACIAIVLAIAIVSAVWALNSTMAPSRGGSGARTNSARWAAIVALLVVLIAVLPPMIRLADWGGSLQKTLVLLTWAASVSLARRAPFRVRTAVVTAAFGLLAFVGTSPSVIAGPPAAIARSADRPLDLGVAIDRYATFDASMTVLLDVFRPVVSDDRFFRTVRAAGDVTDDRSLPAVPFALGDVGGPKPLRPPNIFIVVVDSLRPDYLLAYNPAATFTPAIGAFAKESVVMRRAFTQYAGTALSQPAIWAGGLIQRAMYVKPFAPVNNLERLTVAAGYRRYISIDPPLNAILEDWSGMIRLDAQLTHPERLDQAFKFDLCTTGAELIDRLGHDGANQPVFFYSQPQNVHIRVLAGDSYPRDERVSVSGGSFFKPAVAALTRLDGCFGRFIDGLKRLNLYDDSIVVLTSDHGDSYGEAGRWAHAFYMAPETLRIPLIVHVPEKYLGTRMWDPDVLALLSDVTPTLYDLLGHPPRPTEGIAGRSLLRSRDAAVQPRETVLVQSSYSRVYGLLGGDATWLYVADANHYREETYDLTSGDPFARAVNAAERPQYRKWLLDAMGRLNQFYGRPNKH
jgi:phosphoglycerol transferase MdoB-like AlkP superfamily enzyme